MYSILYVDDEEDLLEIGKLFLENDGTMAVEVLTSAKAALDRIASAQFDAVISDYQMPDMDGIEFLKAVRSRLLDLPFILFTGRGREEVVIEAINNGADFYIQKGGDPCAQFAELAHKVRMAIERRRSEQALQHETAFTQAIFDSVPGILYLYDGNGKLVRWNKNHEIQTGYSGAELAGRNILDWFPDAEDKRKIQESIDLALQDGQASCEANLKTRSGPTIPFIFTARKLEIEGRTYFTGIGIDITERHEAEEALQASEEKFRGISERSSDLIYVEDESGVITYISPSAIRILGFTPGEMTGILADKFVLDEDVQRVKEGRSVKQQGGSIDTFEIRVKRKDGSIAVLDLQSIPIIRDGVFSGLQMIGRDMTGRQKVEQALEESEERFRILTEHSLDTIMLFDRTLRHLYVNPAVMKSLGIPPGEFIGKTHREMGFPEHLVRIWENSIQTVFDSNTSRQVEFQIPNGIWVDWLLVPVHGPDGSVDQVLASARMITKLKLTEESLRRANRQVSLLSAITRHDILNQITMMQAYLHLAGRKEPGPDRDGYFRKLDLSAETIREQIGFTQIYEVIGSCEPQWQDVTTVIAQQPVPEGIFLNTDLPQVEIFADPMLGKVFFNLLDNAARHSGSAGTVGISGQEGQDAYVIHVEDNGSGVAEDEKEKIFERGFGRNTGIGLFLVREILAITGITIRETGTVGTGARFEITVPRGAYRFTNGSV